MKKMNLKRILGIVFAVALLSSCASTSKSTAAKLTKTGSRAFWKIEGTDKNGNPSTVYIQGTFHLGDEQILPLADEVQNAFVNADRLVGEISTQGYAELASRSAELNAPNKDGKKITDSLTDTEKAFLIQVFGENLPLVDPLDPWQVTTALTASLYASSGLSAEYGLDNSFIASAAQLGRTWEGLDEVQTQIDVITYGDYDFQIKTLKEMIRTILDPKDGAELLSLTTGLYKAYVKDDMKEMEKLFNKSNENDVEDDPRNKEMLDLVYKNRNKDWAKDITNYLNEGGTTFIFAGTAHWLGDVSVFKFLRDMKTIN
ncbi:MAG: TraB/GumN family protein [Treponema sp.]|nr:TraB/GumN family protein [Treponema sp.]